jgi:hypothetical protein
MASIGGAAAGNIKGTDVGERNPVLNTIGFITAAS